MVGGSAGIAIPSDPSGQAGRQFGGGLSIQSDKNRHPLGFIGINSVDKSMLVSVDSLTETAFSEFHCGLLTRIVRAGHERLERVLLPPASPPRLPLRRPVEASIMQIWRDQFRECMDWLQRPANGRPTSLPTVG